MTNGRKTCRAASRWGAALCLLATLNASRESSAEERAWTGPSAWTGLDEGTRARVMAFGASYLEFLGRAKTERETVAQVVALARPAGFKSVEPASTSARTPLAPGNKLIFEAASKAAVLVVIGRRPVHEGVRLVAAHVDAVRIDLKPNAIYEDVNLVLLQTQYYGTLHFAQWLSRPLALHGFVPRADGTSVQLRFGSEPADPVLLIPDVLVHLRGRVTAEAGDRLPPEKLDPIVASLPSGEGPGRFKRAFVELLARRYGLRPEDLRAADLSLVPADAPRSVGFDGALVGGYGQDGRAAVFAAVDALLSLTTVPERTAVIALFDRHEAGGTGVAGAGSVLLPRVMGHLLAASGGRDATEQALRETLVRSRALSAEATSGVEPQFKKLHERRNAAFVGGGPAVRAEAGDAEQRAWLHRTLTAARVPHQFADFSRSVAHPAHADTMLPQLTRLGLAGAALGVPVMSMHAPFEVASKLDVYLAKAACAAFFTAPE